MMRRPFARTNPKRHRSTPITSQSSQIRCGTWRSGIWWRHQKFRIIRLTRWDRSCCLPAQGIRFVFMDYITNAPINFSIVTFYCLVTNHFTSYCFFVLTCFSYKFALFWTFRIQVGCYHLMTVSLEFLWSWFNKPDLESKVGSGRDGTSFCQPVGVSWIISFHFCIISIQQSIFWLFSWLVKQTMKHFKSAVVLKTILIAC